MVPTFERLIFLGSDVPQRTSKPLPVLSRLASRGLTGVIVGGVGVYRVTLRPWLGGSCRFYPTCSQYMLLAVRKHGPLRGGWMGLRRIGRCNPWGGSGVDYP